MLFVGVVSSVLASASTALLLSLILPDHGESAGLRDSGSAGGLGSCLGRRADRDLRALARADALPPARPGGSRLPGAGEPAPQAHRVPDERAGRAAHAELEEAFRQAEAALNGLQTVVPRHALPADRPGDARAHGGPPGRRAELAAHRAFRGSGRRRCRGEPGLVRGQAQRRHRARAGSGGARGLERSHRPRRPLARGPRRPRRRAQRDGTQRDDGASGAAGGGVSRRRGRRA